MRYGFLVPPCITFTEASVFIPDGRISRVRLATMAFLDRSSRCSWGLSAGTHTPLTESVCPPSRHLMEPWRGNRALCPGRGSDRHPPCAESPFASPRFTRREWLLATSQGVTPASSLLRTHAPDQVSPTPLGLTLVRWVLAGCCQPLLRNGPSRHYLRNPCIGAQTPTPWFPSSALTRFFPEGFGLTS